MRDGKLLKDGAPFLDVKVDKLGSQQPGPANPAGPGNSGNWSGEIVLQLNE